MPVVRRGQNSLTMLPTTNNLARGNSMAVEPMSTNIKPIWEMGNGNNK
jgi:hypothetical protein